MLTPFPEEAAATLADIEREKEEADGRGEEEAAENTTTVGAETDAATDAATDATAGGEAQDKEKAGEKGAKMTAKELKAAKAARAAAKAKRAASRAVAVRRRAAAHAATTALRSVERDPRGGADALWEQLGLHLKHGVLGCSRERRRGALGGRAAGLVRGPPRGGGHGGRYGGGGGGSGLVAAGGGGSVMADGTDGDGDGVVGEEAAASAWFKRRTDEAAAAAAAARADDEDAASPSDDGILMNRAYNIEELREVQTDPATDGEKAPPRRFLRLRCRWAGAAVEPGSGGGGPVGQWRGRWHAGDARWVAHPDIAAALLPADTRAYKNTVAASGPAESADPTAAAAIVVSVEAGNGDYALGGGCFWMEYVTSGHLRDSMSRCSTWLACVCLRH